jgi:protein-L-isoaspartate O-methyltransferase
MVYEAMRVLPTLGDWLTAYRVHRRFASRPGGKHIATWRALICLAALVRKDQPTAVLEFGTGIGTITYLLLSVSAKLNVVGVEDSPFCIEQLQRNIPEEFKARLTVVSKNGVPGDRRFDLIVIDGRLPPRIDKHAFLRNGTICFVEGNRWKQGAKLMQLAKARNLVCDLEKQTLGAFRTRLRWRNTRLGSFRFFRPALVRRKTCRIGMLHAVGMGVGDPEKPLASALRH